MSLNSLNRDRIPALTALIEKWRSFTREETVHHPAAPREIEEAIQSLKVLGDRLLGYEPPVVVHRLDDRWLIDVARRGTTSEIGPLRSLVGIADKDLARRAPHLASEFRIEGTAFPELVQGRLFSRSRFAFEHPAQELREVVFEFENTIRDRFDTEPFITVYERLQDRFDVHVSLDATTENHVLRYVLRGITSAVRAQHPLLDLALFVDGEPLAKAVDLAPQREPDLDLGLIDFDPSLRIP